MAVEVHDVRLSRDGLRLHPFTAQTEGISIGSTTSIPRIPRRPLNTESTIPQNPTAVPTATPVDLESSVTAENPIFDDRSVPNTEGRSVRSTVPRRPLNTESTLHSTPSPVRITDSSVLGHPPTAENPASDSRSTPNDENVKYCLSTEQSSNSGRTQSEHNMLSQQNTASNDRNSMQSGYGAISQQNTVSVNSNSMQSSYDDLSQQNESSNTQSGYHSLSRQNTASNDTDNMQPSYGIVSQQSTVNNDAYSMQSGSHILSQQITLSNDSSSMKSGYNILSHNKARCALATSHIAAWRIKKSGLKISALAATVLVSEGLLSFSDLEIYMPDDSVEDAGPSDPLSGLALATKGLVMDIATGLADYPVVVSRIMSSKEENRAGVTAQFALDGSQGVSGILGTAVRAPMDFTLNLASGFHNLPKSFGDDTVRVRHVERITGFQSGLKAAGKNFGYGLFDGVTGLVALPMKGAMENGAVGCLKGFGKGIGGVVCKPAAGVCGLPAYMFKGIHEEFQKKRGANMKQYIVAAQKAEGELDAESIAQEEKNEIIRRWHQVKNEKWRGSTRL